MCTRMVRRLAACCALALLACGLGASRALAGESLSLPDAEQPPTAAVYDAVIPHSARRLQSFVDQGSWGGTYTAQDGEDLTIYVSDMYAQDAASAQQWADFAAGLPHGSEFTGLTFYFAPLDEVHVMCGGDLVEGCYFPDQNTLVAPGEDDPAGPTAEEVVRHEYGHHIAEHRDNSPWDAVDWGTKRWASQLDVCHRTAIGKDFPGDEDQHYTFNPGEAFAETYRVYAETKAGITQHSWGVVDDSFTPNAKALQAVADDVLHPWSGPVRSSARGRFDKSGWGDTYDVPTPYDGDATISVSGSAGSRWTIELGNSTFSKTYMHSTTGRTTTLHFTVCGARKLHVGIFDDGRPGTYSVQASLP
jgi:hypothetical protein